MGQDIEAKVVDLDVENHKISLSMKALLPEEQRQEDADVADVDIAAVAREEAEKAEDQQ